MTPNQLQACAKFLGDAYHVVHVYEGEDVLCRDGREGAIPLSDAELFYALLLKAKEQHALPAVGENWTTGAWTASLTENLLSVNGPTPLDALAAAIEKLEQESGNDI